eukprot:183039-Rhodomonas_salina.1
MVWEWLIPRKKGTSPTIGLMSYPITPTLSRVWGLGLGAQFAMHATLLFCSTHILNCQICARTGWMYKNPYRNVVSDRALDSVLIVDDVHGSW